MRLKRIAIIVLLICSCSAPTYAALGDIISSFSSPSFFSRGLAWDGTNLWNSNGVTNLIYKINPSTGAVISSFSTPSINTTDLTFVGGNLWNADIFSSSFYSVDPALGPPWNLEFTKPCCDYFGLAYDGTNLWAANNNMATIDKMDLSGNITSSYIAPSLGPSGLAWDGTYLWNSDTLTDMIYKINPSTGAVISSFSAPGSGNPSGLTFDGQYLWHTDLNGTIYQLDAGYAAPVGATPAPPGVVSLLIMLAALSAFKAIQALLLRRAANN